MQTFNKIENFPKRHLVIFLFTIYWDLACWASVLFLRLFGGELKWSNGLWCITKRKSILMRTVLEGFSGGTLGHGGCLLEGEYSKFHEHVHVEQWEVLAVLVGVFNIRELMLAAISGSLSKVWLTVLVTQFLAGLIGILISIFVTYLRGESIYRGSSHEEAAFARDETK